MGALAIFYEPNNYTESICLKNKAETIHDQTDPDYFVGVQTVVLKEVTV